MNLNREKRKKRRAQADEAIHIVALWNLMLILIPFLLLSAAFSETAILNLMIPAVTASPSEPKPTSPVKVPIQLTLKMDGMILEQGPSQRNLIPLREGRYDITALAALLEDFKRKNATEETIILSSSSHVSYETLIQAMDQCRSAGFPEISLGSDSPGETL
ncbi:MAG: biopolymer transporter ExbD [Nitrospirae bacterium]|nr:biopolymer transporter ExbD [Nitrospirota bacterium]MBI3595469.1 biopolymer transporter ExbD [Nitrospirota bacterium]